MGNRIRPVAAAMAVAFSSAAWQVACADDATHLNEVVVSAKKDLSLPEASGLDPRVVAPLRAATSDTASLLKEVPGVYVQGAGGVSSLPTVHGMGDDRLRIRVDGMDLISACANHMNPPLSYIDPTHVGDIKVLKGVVPVSQGGDSIGATIIVNSPAPRFAEAGAGLLTTGEVGSFYRSNGNANGVNASATIATENLSITYSGSSAQSDNYHSAKDFKPETKSTYARSTHVIAGDEVASSAYKSENHQLGVAYRLDNHLINLKLGYQNIPYQGFANQHMDMTGNDSTQVNLGYTGLYAWGKLEARAYHEQTRHRMDSGEDRRYWFGASANIAGMPMATEGTNTGLSIKAELPVSQRDIVRIGGDMQHYHLDDWWDPVANSGMMMAPNTFWNIRDGRRDRFDVFSEWEAAWSSQWASLVGVRASTVNMDTGSVEGYSSMYNGTTSTYGTAKYFNAKSHARTDHNYDFSALARYTPDAGQTYEGGYSLKTRSPNLYERYTWSNNGMAMSMNNWVNDGNGYIGNIDLKPEVAHTLSLSGDWHDAARSTWHFKLTPYYSRVENYIDATCARGVTCKPGQYNYLTLINQDARLYGFDLAADASLGRWDSFGSLTAHGAIAYVKGKNLTTGDNLYNIMPLNARLSLEHRLGNWSNTIEEQLVSAKDHVSSVRGESKTAGFGLLNLRTSYQWQSVRLDIGLENALNKQYELPLGGAYIGQGSTMSINNTSSTTWSGSAKPPYGYVLPGMGRSVYAGINVKF